MWNVYSLPLSLINSPKFSARSASGRESLKIPLLLAVQMPRQFHFLPVSLNVRHFVRLLGTNGHVVMNRRLYERVDPDVA